LSFNHKIRSSIIIILKIEVSPRQPPGTPFSNLEKGPKSEENDPLPRYQKACCRPATAEDD